MLTSVVYPIPVFSDEERKEQQDKLTATQNAQPAIGTFSMGLYQMLKAAGFQADYSAGHSFGELTALWAGGVLDDDAFLRLAIARGQAMSTPAESGKDTGSMAAVKGNVDRISELIKDFPRLRSRISTHLPRWCWPGLHRASRMSNLCWRARAYRFIH